MASAYSCSLWRHCAQLSGPSITAGSADGTGVTGVAGTAAGVALGGAALGFAALGATAGRVASGRGVAASFAISGDGGGGAAASTGRGVYVSNVVSGPNARRGLFFLRGGLIAGGEERQRAQVTKWCCAASTASSGTASGSMSRSTSTETANAHAGGKCWSIAISILHYHEDYSRAKERKA